MDMNTVEAVVATTDPAEWRDGDAWLAGGTVLFSYGSTVLKRLLDLGQAGWPAVTVNDAGIELAATCTVAELYALQRAEQVSYATDDAGFGPLAFHERLPHAVERLRNHTRTAGCVGLQTHKEPAPRLLAVEEPEFLEWQTAHHQPGVEL